MQFSTSPVGFTTQVEIRSQTLLVLKASVHPLLFSIKQLVFLTEYQPTTFTQNNT